MKVCRLIVVVAVVAAVSGCAWMQRIGCEPRCHVGARSSASLVEFLDNTRWSLGYVTIVGAFVLNGDRHDISTLVDLAVVDPGSRAACGMTWMAR